jgi:hypothetical protein
MTAAAGTEAAPTTRSFSRSDAAIWFAAVTLVAFIGTLGIWAKGLAAPLAVVAVLAVGVLYIRLIGVEAGLIVLLIVANVGDHFTFPVGPLAIRAEQVAALLAAAVLIARCLRRADLSIFRPRADEWLLLAWIAVSALSSVLDSPDRRLSAKVLVLTAVCTLGFFLPRRLLSGPEATKGVDIVVRWLLIAFATESIYGVLAYLLHVFGPSISIGPNPASGHLEAYGTLWEQNVFGAFAASGAVAWVYLGPARFKRAWIGLTMCAGGLVASLTRAAWLAAAAAGGLGVLIPGLRRRLDFPMVGTGLLGGLMVAVLVIVADQLGTYTAPVSGATSGGTPHPSHGLLFALLNMTDFIGRLNQTRPVWSDISGGYEVIGRGTASFEALHIVAGVPEHVASLPLLVLNDTGIVGLVLFVGFVALIVARLWARRHDGLVGGLAQAAIVVGLANLATETTELMLDWLLIGILIAAVDISRSAAKAAHAPPE